MDSKYTLIINLYSRGEFRIPINHKRKYALFLVRIVYKYLNNKFIFEFDSLNQDEQLLIRHIFEANELADLKSWIGIAINKKYQK